MGYVDVPVFILTRDRLTDLQLLVEWLENAGHQRITFLDNASTWPPLLEYLECTPHEVVRLPNLGSRAIWHAGLVPSEPFVLTDCDVVPAPFCPLNLVERLGELLEQFWLPKVAVGLVIDDLPPELDKPNAILEGMSIREWEQELVHPRRLLEPAVYDSIADTTFALWRGGSEFVFQAIRTGFPWQAHHRPWYRSVIDEEHAYYLAHAEVGPEGTTWTP